MSQSLRTRSLAELGIAPADVIDSAVVVQIPMRVRFRGLTHREATLIRGPQGWAEFSPFPEYADVESSRWLRSAVESAWGGWPTAVRDVVPVNATLPAVSADQVPGILDRFPGCRTVKIKVAEPGQSLRDDIERVAAARDYLGSAGKIRVDANGGWDVGAALVAIAKLHQWDLEYAEQPVPEVADLAQLRVLLAHRGISVPIAADESIRKAEDPFLVAKLEAADLMVVKVAPLGGVRSALDIVAQVGLPAVVSSAIDTSVGLAAGVALAAALPDLPYACGLGTAALLDGDVVANSLLPTEGSLTLERATHAIHNVSQGDVEQWRAEPAREDWWKSRLERCVALIT